MTQFRFDSLAALWAMDGHGPYVWLCVGLALLVVLGNIIALRRARGTFVRAARGRLQRRMARGLRAHGAPAPVPPHSSD